MQARQTADQATTGEPRQVAAFRDSWPRPVFEDQQERNPPRKCAASQRADA